MLRFNLRSEQGSRAWTVGVPLNLALTTAALQCTCACSDHSKNRGLCKHCGAALALRVLYGLSATPVPAPWPSSASGGAFDGPSAAALHRMAVSVRTLGAGSTVVAEGVRGAGEEPRAFSCYPTGILALMREARTQWSHARAEGKAIETGRSALQQRQEDLERREVAVREKPRQAEVRKASRVVSVESSGRVVDVWTSNRRRRGGVPPAPPEEAGSASRTPPSGDAAVSPEARERHPVYSGGFHTADLEFVFVDLIEALGRDVAVAVVGDAATTRRNKNTTSQLQLRALRGARMGPMQGRVRTECCARGPPSSWSESKRTIFHGKVLVADRTMIIGGCNCTASSPCNVERGVALELSDDGFVYAAGRFDRKLQMEETL